MNTTHSHADAPAILVVFGATGDLASRKIFPALWHLYEHGRLPERFLVVGVARGKLSHEQFQQNVIDAVRACDVSSEKDLTPFVSHFSYYDGDFTQDDTYRTLKTIVEEKEHVWGTDAQRLLYMAVPSTLYTPVLKGIALVGLNELHGENKKNKDKSRTRLLIEKPFGKSGLEAEELDELLKQHFTEEQIYRIDHYLFKEIIQGIENFRFSNNLFEGQWDNTNIERIDVRLLETIGVKDRGDFYDTVGALRDVGQNHLLEMLAAITMEYPSEMTAKRVQDKRAELLETLAPWDATRISENTYRAQYEGYREIPGVADDSQTETYFALKTELTHPRWQGVPVYMESGKCLGEARKEIVLTLKHPEVCHLCRVGEHGPNRITFRLEPNDEVCITFWSKKPGFENELEESTFSFFLYEKENKTQYVEEYAKILDAAMKGERRLFVGSREVEALWHFTDPVVRGWQENLAPLHQYAPGTTLEPTFLARASEPEVKTRKEKGTIGMVGLGRMGFHMALHLHEEGYEVYGADPSEEARTRAKEGNIRAFESVADMVAQFSAPRIIWLMVPSKFVDGVLEELMPLLDKGDTIIDGGNSFYKDTLARHKQLQGRGINFLDCGTSGGVEGARQGASLMIGGEEEVFSKQEDIFKTLAAKDGYALVGGPGAGHFVKMVHNGIEYGMMGSIAEGMSVLYDHKEEFDINLENALKAYAHESIIDSKLVDWLADAYQAGQIERITGEVPHGETEDEMEHIVDIAGTPILNAALNQRKGTRKKENYAGKLIAAMRNQFGGHDVYKNNNKKS
ncbi:MAG: glucose-6-phosphate dehydrogenase [Candidatus Paceibacterota bacterium]